MKKHIQQFIGNGIGSCYPTCIACIFNLELNEIPNVNLLYFSDSQLDLIEKELDIKKDDADFLWWTIMSCFLITKGYVEERYNIEESNKIICNNKNIIHLINGISPRNFNHSVVGVNGIMIHDPHPEGGGVIPESFSFFKNINNNTYLTINKDHLFTKIF